MSADEGRSGPRAASWIRRHSRWLGALVLVVALALIAGAATAYHFSSAVLVPDHSSWPADIAVVEVSRDRIVLERGSEDERPGIYGLDWPGGHAIVGEVLAAGEDQVTRRVRASSGYLVPGMKVAFDPRVYVGDPHQALGLRYADVRVPDELGPMPAWLVPGPSATWAIVVHGINDDRQVGLRILPTLHRAGMPALLISYRDDLGAPPSPDGLHHMGLTEWRDVEAATEFALAHGARRVVLVGYSMGGALVSQFMQRSRLAARAAGLVLDAPALDWRSILEFNSEQMGLPSFLALPVVWAIDARVNPDWGSLDALDHRQDFQLPILLFHGAADTLVPPSTSDSFAAELPEWVTYYRVPKAEHTQSWNVDPRLYDHRLSTFLREIEGRPARAS
jgi:pimeloyl-ACP methyl ester carboxylesterase